MILILIVFYYYYNNIFKIIKFKVQNNKIKYKGKYIYFVYFYV